MYGGLFGDLPSTKKSKADEKKETTAADKDKESQPSRPQQDANDGSSKKRPASLVEKLGAAGTTMAFVPVALRNRKRVNSSTVPPAAKAPAKLPPQASANSSSVPFSVSLIHSNNTFNDPTSSVRSSVDHHDQESEAMRLLHASVVDVYDPHEPNDLLAYWDRKVMERERLALEREAKETLQRQENLRQQLEQERQSLQQSGNIQGILQQQAMGRGRGRGVSNLPAWLVQKQKDELGSSGGGVAEKQPQCTVVLSNLTAPGDIDDELADEVKEECEEQCGSVTSVVVKDASPPHQPVVQVHVGFGNRADADKAIRIFHGRKFGQRRITAEFLPPQP